MSRPKEWKKKCIVCKEYFIVEHHAKVRCDGCKKKGCYCVDLVAQIDSEIDKEMSKVVEK